MLNILIFPLHIYAKNFLNLLRHLYAGTKTVKINKPILPLVFLLAAATGCSALENRVTEPEKKDTGSALPETGQKLQQTENHYLLDEAVKAYYAGNLENAVETLKILTEIDPANRKAAYSLALLLAESSFPGDAASVAGKYDSNFSNIDLLLEKPGSLWEDHSFFEFLSGNSGAYLEFSENRLREIEEYSSIKDFGGEKDKYKAASEIISEIQFCRGLAYYDLDMPVEAEKSFLEAVETRGYFPVSNMLLGMLYFKSENYMLSEKHFATALRLDSGLTQARPFLAKAIIAQGRKAEGYSALRRALAIRPWDRETAEYTFLFEKENPELLAEKTISAKKRRTETVVPSAGFLTAEPGSMPAVRVGLGEKLHEVFLKTGGLFTLADNSGNIIMTGEKGRILKIAFQNNGMIIADAEDNPDNPSILSTETSFSIYCNNPADTIMLFDVSHSNGYQSAGQEDRSYRGSLSFIPFRDQGFTVVNTLPLEEYLYSVVPSEIPAAWPLQALEAQAVAARSYTLANMGRFNGRGFDVSGSITSAFYRGLTGESSQTTAAVNNTRGLVLKHDGKYLNAFYSANSAGRTESAESVWDMNAPLTGVKDPQLSFESDPPSPDELARWILSEPDTFSSVPGYYYRSSYRWRLIVPADEIEARTGGDLGRITGITTRGRGSSGRVEEVLVTGQKGSEKISGDKIRSRLGGLRSNLFIVVPKMDKDGFPEYFIFAGAGWGHGVGMCQSGAAGMANKGFSHAEILSHYYPLAEIVREY